MAENENPTTAATSATPWNMGSRRSLNARMVQNFHLVWLHGSVDEGNDDDYRNSITKLRQVVNTVSTFMNVDECIDFITDNTEETTLMMVSETFSQIIVPVVQDIPQVSSVYIFGENKMPHEKWANEWPIVHGVYTDITVICEALKQAAQDCDQNLINISFIKSALTPSNQNLNQLDQSFMNTQLLKDILLTIDFEQQHINDFLTYCHEQFAGNIIELGNVEKLRKEYRHHQPIWWYTYQCFLYSMLNRALRTLEVDLIIKMGFFVRDLHQHIAALHVEQYGRQNPSDPFIVYRGQGLSQIDFDQLMKMQGGLLAFNNFLSTSKNRDVSLRFARRTIATSSLVGVFFILKIDPSIDATPFANVGKVSCYQREEEILFSMHSVFRIGQIKQIDGNNRLWQVDLTLTGDNDRQLQALIKSMREKTQESTGWFRLGQLMITLGQFNKAEELYEILLKQTTDEGEKGYLFHQLGQIKYLQGDHTEAVTWYEKTVRIYQKTLPANHPDLATSYNDIGLVYDDMSEYSKALSYYEKALEIRRKTLPANHPHLATSYNNIGTVYKAMGEYSKVLSYYEKTLEIEQKTLPANHPHLATSYNNIGSVYDNLGEYSNALLYYEKALEIKQKTLPADHPSLATSYNNIGAVYKAMGEFSKAFSYFEKTLEIEQKTLPTDHPSLATSYNNIGVVYEVMGEYSKALSYHEKTVEIYQKTLPANHPLLATSYNNIGSMYRTMGEYSKALSYYEKALKIQQKTLPTDHPSLATSYNNIGSVYDNMGQYSKAFSYCELALRISERSLPSDHPNIQLLKKNLESVKRNCK